MKKFENVRSTEKPEEKAIDEYSVWIAENVHTVSVTVEDQTVEEYEYDLTQYDKDEYIKLLDERDQSMESDITNLQLALCDMYESTL